MPLDDRAFVIGVSNRACGWVASQSHHVGHNASLAFIDERQTHWVAHTWRESMQDGGEIVSRITDEFPNRVAALNTSCFKARIGCSAVAIMPWPSDDERAISHSADIRFVASVAVNRVDGSVDTDLRVAKQVMELVGFGSYPALDLRAQDKHALYMS